MVEGGKHGDRKHQQCCVHSVQSYLLPLETGNGKLYIGSGCMIDWFSEQKQPLQLWDGFDLLTENTPENSVIDIHVTKFSAI